MPGTTTTVSGVTGFALNKHDAGKCSCLEGITFVFLAICMNGDITEWWLCDWHCDYWAEEMRSRPYHVCMQMGCSSETVAWTYRRLTGDEAWPEETGQYRPGS